VGNAILGLPIGPDMEYTGGFFNLLQPYPLVVGLFAVSLFAMHGSIYLYLKTEGGLQERVRGWMWHTFGIFLVFYIFTTIFTLVAVPEAARNFREIPWAWVVVVLNVLAVANIPRAIFLGKPFYAFLSSAAVIAALNFLFGVALFPNLVVSNLNPEWSITIYNAASSEKTLSIMRLIAFIGMPFVLAYTTVIYWVFRGKVEIGKFSY
jgi:cytochrome d ubiquinol oxidase subunit II